MTRRPTVCTTCQRPLVKGACPKHGARNRDGSSRDEHAALRANKGKRFPAQPLPAADVKRLLEACTSSATGRRNAALIATLYGAGLRVTEALTLYPRDVSDKDGTLWIGRGKGGRQRTVSIDSEALLWIRAWMDAREKLGLSRHRALFCTIPGVQPGGRPISSSYVRHLLPRLAKRAGIERRVNAHAMRHAHAAELSLERVPVAIISKQLGHSNLSTTSAYLDHIAPADLVEALRDRPAWDDRAGA